MGQSASPLRSSVHTPEDALYRTIFAQALDMLPQMIWTATPEGMVDYANQRCLDYSGMKTEEKYGEGWTATIHPDDLPAMSTAWMESMNSGTPFENEYRIRNASGEYRWFLGRALPIRDATGKIQYWIGTATDIEVQRQAIAKLEHERTLREQFVATLTHDLRAPLSAAKMSAQLVTRQLHSPERVTSLTGRIIDSLSRVSRMIENLLDANRIRAGEPLYLEMRELSIYHLVSESLIELASVHGDRFVLKAKDPQIFGSGSADVIRRIVENLCTNAVKYGERRAPITVTLEQAESTISIHVHNVGNPIAPEAISKLFDPFERSIATDGAPKPKGWGLGLTLVKGFAEAHGGSVSVTSDRTLGTTFTVTLPQATLV